MEVPKEVVCFVSTLDFAMRLTRVPVRRRALWMREERVEEDDVATMELLTRLQRRYDADDALTAARVLYDIEDSGDEDEKGALKQPHIKDHPAPTAPVTPSKPPRPPPELLRGLLEISPPSLSTGTPHEDTSADSRLAPWLERIAQDQSMRARLPGVVPQASKEAIFREVHHAQDALLPLSPLDAHESHVDRPSMPPSALKSYPTTPLSGRPRPTPQALFKQALFKHGRASSAPATPISDASMYSQPSPLVRLKQVRFDVPAESDSSLNITLARTRNSSLVEISTNFSNPSVYDSASDLSTDASLPFIPPLDFGFAEPSLIEVPWMQELSPAVDGNLQLCMFLLPLNGVIEIEETPWSPKTPLHTTTDNSQVNDADEPSTLFHPMPISSELIEALESARDDDSFDRHVGALRDLSGIYTTNLALQHISKSPMVIRNWQRVLDELTGRSRERAPRAPRVWPEREPEFANNEEAHAHGTALGLDGTPDISKAKVGPVCSPSSSESMLDTCAREDTLAYSLIDGHSFPRHETQADRGLDHEFIRHLRLSIERKRTEVELLKKLETQRLKVIHRLERVLSRKTLELLTSDPY